MNCQKNNTSEMTLTPCIFCRALDVERTREHVVQRALGGSLTLPTEVCAVCNAAFSPFDKDLVEHVNLFARHDVSSLLRLGLQEDPGAGVRLSARLGLRGEETGLAAAPPQLFRHLDGTWQFRGPSVDGLEAMVRELAGPTPRVKEVVDPDEPGEAPVALAVVRTAPSTFLVCGSDASEVRELANKIREKGLGLTPTGDPKPWVPPTEVAPITIKTAFPVGNISRCLAKMALGYVCTLFGPQMVLSPAFDRVRRFARYGEEGFLDLVIPALLAHTQQDAVLAFSDPARHALVLLQTEQDGLYRVGVQVVLYGKAVGLVRLAATPAPLLPLGTWRVTYFDHEKKTFEHLTIPRDGLRCFCNIDALVPGASALLEGP